MVENATARQQPGGVGGWVGSDASRIAGLDGLRGIAVAMVLVYHLWPAVLPGGFLGVTMFFALSGFLIVGLLQSERQRTGTVDLRAFFSRRIRRLLPASMIVLALVTATWSLAGWMTGTLSRDLVFSVLQLANWGQLWGGEAYGVADAPSPVVHYWSLAIEEQAYLVLPLVVLALGGRPRVLLGAVTVGIVASAALTWWAAGDPIQVYYSTFIRIGEILCGALAALMLLAWRDRRERRGRAGGPRNAPRPARRWSALMPAILAGLVAAGGLAAMLSMAVRWSVRSEIVSEGGLLIAGAVSAVIVLAVAGAPRVGHWLDHAALAWLGRISYGVYLIHWPLMLGLREAGLTDPLVPWLTLVLTLLLAVASARWVETPIRFGGIGTRGLVGGFIAMVMLIPTVGALSPRAASGPDFEAAAAAFESQLRSAPRPAAPEPTGRPNGRDAGEESALTRPSRESGDLDPPHRVTADGAVDDGEREDPIPDNAPLLIGYFGDSKAVALALGTGREPPEGWFLGSSYARLGCPMGRGGAGRLGPGERIDDYEGKCGWDGFFATGGDHSPDASQHVGNPFVAPLDVAIIWFGTWDTLERRVPGLGDEWVSMADPIYQDWLREELRGFVDALVSSTAPALVFLVTLPIDDTFALPADLLAERIADQRRWNDLLVAFANEATRTRDFDGSRIEVLDLAGWVSDHPESERLLPDGAHPSFGEDGGANSAAEITSDYVLPRARELLATRIRARPDE